AARVDPDPQACVLRPRIVRANDLAAFRRPFTRRSRHAGNDGLLLPMANANQLSSIDHVVTLMLENRSLDHMLGFLYASDNNVSPTGQPFEGLTGTESNLDVSGKPVTVSRIEPTTPNAYRMPGANPGEGYMATNNQ